MNSTRQTTDPIPLPASPSHAEHAAPPTPAGSPHGPAGQPQPLDRAAAHQGAEADAQRTRAGARPEAHAPSQGEVRTDGRQADDAEARLSARAGASAPPDDGALDTADGGPAAP